MIDFKKINLGMTRLDFIEEFGSEGLLEAKIRVERYYEQSE